MEQGCTSRYSTLIDKLMVEDLPPRKMSELQGHLASCAACQHRYNRVVLAARMLDGSQEALDLPSERELGWVEQAVLERTRLVPDTQPTRRSVLRWVVALAGAAAALAIALPLALRSGPPTRHGSSPAEFQARGAPPKVSQQVGVRAFCIQQRADHADPVVFEATAAEGSTCQVNDILRFAYTNRSRLSYLFLVGLDTKLNIKWYEPHPPNKTSIKVQQRVANEPLSRAVNLKVNHHRGPVRLFAIFSDMPIHADEVKRAVQQLKREGLRLGRIESLPLENTEQRSVLVNLAGDTKKP